MPVLLPKGQIFFVVHFFVNETTARRVEEAILRLMTFEMFKLPVNFELPTFAIYVPGADRALKKKAFYYY